MNFGPVTAEFKRVKRVHPSSISSLATFALLLDFAGMSSEYWVFLGDYYSVLFHLRARFSPDSYAEPSVDQWISRHALPAWEAAAATGCYSSEHLVMGRADHAYAARHWLSVQAWTKQSRIWEYSDCSAKHYRTNLRASHSFWKANVSGYSGHFIYHSLSIVTLRSMTMKH